MDQVVVVGFCFILAALFVSVLWLIARILSFIGEAVQSGVHHVRINRRLKAFNGQRCFHCGYDLRANTHRCPECGHHIPVRPIF